MRRKKRDEKFGTLPLCRIGDGDDAQEVENVSAFQYLGCSVEADGTDQRKIEMRCVMAASVAGQISNVLKSPALSLSQRLRVFEVCVLSGLLYGCETWILTGCGKKRLRVNVARMVARVTKRIPKEETTMQTIDVLVKIVARRAKYVDDILRLEDGRWLRELLPTMTFHDADMSRPRAGSLVDGTGEKIKLALGGQPHEAALQAD